MENLQELKPVGKLSPLAKFCCTIGNLPTSYMISLTYEEQLLWLCNYLENTVIPAVNINAKAVAELQGLYIQLKNYVDNYFDNLDVQQEINNKLDEMVEDGSLEQIIEQFINSTCVWCFDTVADMKSATNLIDGSYARTTGYYSSNDGGGALYKIVENLDSNEYQETLNSGLYANLIVCGNCISFKQLGAKGDGLTNNASIISKGLSFVKNKNIGNLYINEGTFIINEAQMVIPNGLHLYGSGETSILQINHLTNEVFMTNENFLNQLNIKDTFVLENFRINNQAIETGTNGKRCMRFGCTKDITIRNIIFYSDVDSQFSCLDLYTNNYNTLVENCKCYKTGSDGQTLTGGFLVRQWFENGTTENVTLRNCYVEKDGLDESLWIDGWRGLVKNVLIDNFTMKDTTTSQNINCVAVMAERNGSICRNVTFRNCYFYKAGIRNRMMNLGHSEVEGAVTSVDNILIDNCTFETDEILTTGTTQFINIGEFLVNKGATVRNCKFINNDNNNSISYFINSNIENPLYYSENNKFYGKSNVGMRRMFSSKNDYFEKAPTTCVFKYCSNIDNFKCDEVIPYLNMVQNENYCNNIIISNLQNMQCNDLISFSNIIIDIDVKIINSEIINERNIVRSYNQGDHVINAELLDCDIKTPTITNAFTINLKSSNLSVLGEIFKGIPTNSQDRNNYPIGTVFFSSTPTKSIVRKISEGNASSNWEEI